METAQKKASTKSKICRKTAKSDVKTAKKPVLVEKMAADNSSQETTQPQKKNRHGDPARFGDKSHRWSAEEALAAAKKGGTMKGVRAAIMNDFARAAAQEGRLSQMFARAIETNDPLLLTMAERAARMVGATFDQSPDAKQRVELDGKLDNTLNVKISEA